MTTWHPDFEEGIWFGFFAAHHDEVTIDNVVILDMASGQENETIDKLIKGFKETG